MKKYQCQLAKAALGLTLLGASLAAAPVVAQAASEPNYEGSIKVGNGNEGESGEAAILSSMAKIDASKATAAALGQVPGTVLKVSLDNENGNVVYSVEIKTADNQVRDVKVDAGTAAILNVDSGDDESENGENGERGENGGEEESSEN